MATISHSYTRAAAHLVARYSLHVYATLFRCVGWLWVVGRYYLRYPDFACSDMLLAIQYLWRSPYAHVRAWAPETVYGETPLPTLDAIMRAAGCSSRDTVVEIGCGTGRTALWLAHVIGCHVIGLDYVPAFIEKAQRVVRWRHLDRVTLVEADILKSSFDRGTLFYFYGTTHEDAFIEQVVAQLIRYGREVVVITTSYPLTEYSDRFTLLKTLPGRFPWGTTTVYIQRLTVERGSHLVPHT